MVLKFFLLNRIVRRTLAYVIGKSVVLLVELQWAVPPLSVLYRFLSLKSYLKLLLPYGFKKHSGNYGETETMERWWVRSKRLLLVGLIRPAGGSSVWSRSTYKVIIRLLHCIVLGHVVQKHPPWAYIFMTCETAFIDRGGTIPHLIPSWSCAFCLSKNYWVSWCRIWKVKDGGEGSGSSSRASSDLSLALPPFPLRRLYAVPLSSQGPSLSGYLSFASSNTYNGI